MNRIRLRSRHLKHNGVTRFHVVIVSSLVGFVLLGWLALNLRPGAKRNAESNSVVRVYCAAGIATPIEQAMKEFSEKYDVRIELAQAGGSGALAGQIASEFKANIDHGADLYITADDTLLDRLGGEGIVAERFNLAVQNPVIAIRADSDLKIESLKDLVSSGVSYGISSEGAAIGVLARGIAKREGIEEELVSNCKTEAENVMALGHALVSGSLEAAIIWNTTCEQINQKHKEPVLKISAVADPKSEFQGKIAIGVISSTKTPPTVLKLARYIASEHGLEKMRRFGFETVEGDQWEEVPEIHLYCGSMFTPVLEEKIREFEEREGVKIYPRWEGCGKLVAAMRSIKDPDLLPDAYLACDQKFLESVQDFFKPPLMISSNDILLAVRENSKTEINGPQDLLDSKVRVGICDPDQSALGHLTKQMFTQSPYENFYEKLEQSAAVTVDVGPTLVSQLMAGGLDAAIVYRSNVSADPKVLKQLKLIELGSKDASHKAIQPWAISKTTKNPRLMNRLLKVIISADTVTDFQEAGFNWEYKSETAD